jgi:hypothetical protein
VVTPAGARKPFFLAPMAIEAGEVIHIPTAAAIVGWSMNQTEYLGPSSFWGRADYEDAFGEMHQLRLSRNVALDHLANPALEPTQATPPPCVCIVGGPARQLHVRQAGRSYPHSLGNHQTASWHPPVHEDVGGKQFFTTEEQLHLFHADE